MLVNVCFSTVFIFFLLLSLPVCLCSPYLVRSESRSWCLGMNGIFWDRSVLLCVCQTCCASIAHTRKATSPRLLLSTMPENSTDYAGYRAERTRVVLSFAHLWTFASTTLKSILYLFGYKSFLWTQEVYMSARVGFQLLDHFFIIYLIDFQPCL